MTLLEVVVLISGLAAIALVNWYFFGSGGRVVEAAMGAGGVREVRIEVLGGYAPSTVRVRRGEKVRLVFDRRETSGCSEELVVPDFEIRRYLPAHEETVVELTPDRVGTHEFTCGMGMLRGRLIVEDGS